MTKQDIIDKVKTLNLPAGSFVVFGSCPMAAAGIRESSDVDLFVNEATFAELKHRGWRQLPTSSSNKAVVHDVYDAHTNWDCGSYRPTLEQLLVSAFIVDDVPFVSLDELRNWKVASGRPKDMVDIKLIDDYLTSAP